MPKSDRLHSNELNKRTLRQCSVQKTSFGGISALLGGGRRIPSSGGKVTASTRLIETRTSSGCMLMTYVLLHLCFTINTMNHNGYTIRYERHRSKRCRLLARSKPPCSSRISDRQPAKFEHSHSGWSARTITNTETYGTLPLPDPIVCDTRRRTLNGGRRLKFFFYCLESSLYGIG